MEGLNFKRGFTLIELLVVTGIIILLSALFLANYDLMQWQIDLDTQAQKMMSVLKQAQAMALTGKKIGGVRPDGFGVYFGANSYILFADSNSNHTYDTGNDSIIQSFNLTEEMSLNATTSIVFTVPEAKTYRDGDLLTEETYLKLTHSKSDASKQVRINTYGRIEISSSSLLDSLWSYRRPVTIDSTQQLDNYQIALDITDKIYNNTNLVGSWHLNEGTGTSAADTSGNGNDGTLTNGPTWVDGKYGKALSFDGGDNYVSVGDKDILDFGTENFSVSFWTKWTTTVGYRGIVSKWDGQGNHNGWDIGCQDGSGQMHWNILSTNYPSGVDQISTQQTFNDDQWHHFVLVRGSGGVMKIYADGDNQTLVLDYGDGINNENVNNAISFAIGRKNSGGQSWDGLIDEVRVYSRVLSPTEISDLYSATKARLDYSDLRFADEGKNELSYWLESDNKAWVETTSLSTGQNTIYMYYGNSSATSQSSVANTFIREINGVKGSWEYEESSGATAYDSSGNGNNLTITGTPTYQATGVVDKSLEFSGSQRVGSGFDISNDNTFSISFWLYDKSVTNDTRRWFTTTNGGVGNGDGNIMLRESGGGSTQQFTLGLGLPTFTWASYISGINWKNAWHMFTINSDGTYTKVYLDTTEVISVNGCVSNPAAGVNVPGYYSGSGTEYYIGKIDEIKIFDRTLTTTEISDLYGTGGDRDGYTTTNYPGKVLVRKYVSPEPTPSIGAEESTK